MSFTTITYTDLVHLVERLTHRPLRIVVVGDWIEDELIVCGEPSDRYLAADYDPTRGATLAGRHVMAGGAGAVAAALERLTRSATSKYPIELVAAVPGLEGRLIERRPLPATCKPPFAQPATRIWLGGDQVADATRRLRVLRQHYLQAARETLLRIDDDWHCPSNVATALAREAVDRGRDADCVVWADYGLGACDALPPPAGGGLLSPAGLTAAPAPGVLDQDWCTSETTPHVIDPWRERDWRHYRGATLIKATRAEADGQDLSEFQRVLVTDGERPIELLQRGKGVVQHGILAATAVDPVGCGDAVTAVVALAVACGLSRDALVPLSVVAGDAAIRKLGTTPIDWQDLEAAAQRYDAGPTLSTNPRRYDNPWCAPETGLEQPLPAGSVVLPGCWDLLHAGHLVTIREARRHLGAEGLLVALVPSDPVVRALKGVGRPVQRQWPRAGHLSLLGVHCTFQQNDVTPDAMLARLRPKTILKGGTTDPAEIERLDALARTWGGRCVQGRLVDGVSTTLLSRRSSLVTAPA